MSLYLKQIEVGPMANFVYLIGDPIKREVFVVDPAWQMDTIFKIAETEKLKIVGALITHSHFDHCNGIEDLLTKTDVPLYVQKDEAEFVKSVKKSHPLFSDFPAENLRKVHPGDQVAAGAIEITFLHTPGHTPGSQCFLAENYLLSGDTLFIRGCGRCDLPGSDPKQMYASLTQTLMKLPGQTTLFPGHNYAEAPSSLLSDEKRKNPYLLCDSLETFLKMIGSYKRKNEAQE